MLQCALVAVCVLLVCVWLVRDARKPAGYPPGPRWLPVLGSLLAVWRLHGKLGLQHRVWAALTTTWGPVVGLRVGREHVLLACSADAVREVLARDEFQGRPAGFFFRMRTFGRRLGLVFVEGPLWHEQRRFTVQQLRYLGMGRREMGERVAEEAHHLAASLRGRAQPLQLHGLFDVSVLNVLWAMLAGERFELDDARLRDLMDIIHEQFRAIDTSGGMLNQMPWLRWLAPGRSGYTRHQHTLRRLLGFLRDTVRAHQSEQRAGAAPRDLIDAYLQRMAAPESGDLAFSEQQLLALCMDLFMAGSETTANTLEFVVLYLTAYGDVQARVAAELDAVLGRVAPTLEDRARLPYMRAVLREVQRVAHAAPGGIVHRATRDARLLGYHVPRDTLLITNLYALHTDPHVFPEPHAFRPERFLSLDADTVDMHYAPFGRGKRRCLGEPLAAANLFLMTATLFQHFTITTVDGVQPDLEPLGGVTLSPRPCQILLTARH